MRMSSASGACVDQGRQRFLVSVGYGRVVQFRTRLEGPRCGGRRIGRGARVEGRVRGPSRAQPLRLTIEGGEIVDENPVKLDLTEQSR
jgi:hypothetical protein